MATKKKLQIELAAEKAKNNHQVKIQQQQLALKVCFLHSCKYLLIWECIFQSAIGYRVYKKSNFDSLSYVNYYIYRFCVFVFIKIGLGFCLLAAK
jgi:hypothetical protein